MLIRIEIDESLNETEIVIKTPKFDSEIENLQKNILQANKRSIVFYKGNSEYFFDFDKILFFITEENKVFAHTTDNSYEVRLKLYELESILPAYFCRIAKSSIVNTKGIFSLERSFSGTSTIHFQESLKKIHVSRHYYQILKEKIYEMR